MVVWLVQCDLQIGVRKKLGKTRGPPASEFTGPKPFTVLAPICKLERVHRQFISGLTHIESTPPAANQRSRARREPRQGAALMRCSTKVCGARRAPGNHV